MEGKKSTEVNTGEPLCTGSALNVLLSTNDSIMSEMDQTTIIMLKNLIKNVEQGYLTTLDRSGVQPSDDVAEITLIMKGKPLIHING